MNTEDVKNLSSRERLVYWITERESIRVKNESLQPRPWTGDKILDTYRFCNVRRMDDRVSRWLLDNWYTPNRGHPNMVLAVALARFINLPESLQEIGFPKRWSPSLIKSVLQKRRERGLTVFNNAYIIPAGRVKGSDKVETVVDFYVSSLVDFNELNIISMENTWSILKNKPGMGSFLAGQVVADLRWAVTGMWSDKKVWAPLGPGSTRGINRLLGRDLDARVSQSQFNTELRELITYLNKSLPPNIITRLEAMDVQNCLCEFDKYERVLWEQGKPKQLYKQRV